MLLIQVQITGYTEAKATKIIQRIQYTLKYSI